VAVAIELICKGCAQKLRVSEQNAGKQARCPKCGAIFTVPMGDLPSRADLGALPRAAATYQDQWYLRAEDGRTFGPVSKPELDAWVREGRVTPESNLRKESDSSWRPASELYPALTEQAATAAKNPFAEAKTNPYTSPVSSGTHVPRRHYQQAHRGGTILAMGIAGIVCCNLLGIAAWIMAATDLSAMRTGRMDPGGKGLTIAGMVLGIIATIIFAISIAGNFVNLANFR
jgi:hypothetical protein